MNNKSSFVITTVNETNSILNPFLRPFNSKEIQKINLVINSTEVSSNKLRQILSPGKTLTDNDPLSIIPALIVNINDEFNDFLSKKDLIELNTMVSNNKDKNTDKNTDNIFNIGFLKDKLSIDNLVNFEQQYSNLIDLINIATLKKHNELCFTKKAKMQFMLSKLMLLSILLKILMGRIKEFTYLRNNWVNKKITKEFSNELMKLKQISSGKNKNDFDWLIHKLDATKNFPSKTIYLENTASYFSNILKIARLSFWATIYKKVMTSRTTIT